MNKSFKVIIPARYESTRFPGKPLADLNGKPMVQHVYEAAVASGAEEVIIATDNTHVGMAAEDFGATVCMSLGDHDNGSDRLCEIIDKQSWDDETIIVNLQCDQPFTPADAINQVATNLLNNKDADCSTLCAPLASEEDIADPHIIKVIADSSGNVMYFSRNIIPYNGHINYLEYPSLWNRHIGLFAYRVRSLRKYKDFPVCDLEKAEKFEHMRVLWNGMRINVATATSLPGPSVHTKEDLEKAKLSLAADQKSLSTEDSAE